MINKQTLLTGWSFMRWLRLGIGVFFAMQAIQMHDGLAGVISVLFLFQAVTNTGCCGSNGCDVYTEKKDAGNKIEDVSYEEIKTK